MRGEKMVVLFTESLPIQTYIIAKGLPVEKILFKEQK